MMRAWEALVPDYIRERISIEERDFVCGCGARFPHSIMLVDLAKHAVFCGPAKPESPVKECGACHRPMPRNKTTCIQCQKDAQKQLERLRGA